MNIYDNIAFGLKIKTSNLKLIKSKDILKLISLEGFEKEILNHYVSATRVAIARALVNEPKVLPLMNLLSIRLKLRKEMQLELKKIQKRLGITFIFVTHDQEEANHVRQNIVMNKGKYNKWVLQKIYNEPANACCWIIGESNILDGIMLEDYKVKFSNKIFECVDKGFCSNENIDIVIRPEDIKIVSADKGMLKGTVKSVILKVFTMKSRLKKVIINGYYTILNLQR